MKMLLQAACRGRPWLLVCLGSGPANICKLYLSYSYLSVGPELMYNLFCIVQISVKEGFLWRISRSVVIISDVEKTGGNAWGKVPNCLLKCNMCD